jgi:hypothetical protein
MTEALVKSIQAEYRDLLAVGAQHSEAVKQVALTLELHVSLVEAFINFDL